MSASLYLPHTCGGVVRADVGADVTLSGRNIPLKELEEREVGLSPDVSGGKKQ